MVMEARVERRDRSHVSVVVSGRNPHVRNTGDAMGLRVGVAVDEADTDNQNNPVSFSTVGSSNGRRFVCTMPDQTLRRMLTGRAGVFSQQTCRPAARESVTTFDAREIEQNGYRFEPLQPTPNDRFLIGRFTAFPSALPSGEPIRATISIVLSEGSGFQTLELTREHAEIRLNYTDISPGNYTIALAIAGAFSHSLQVSIPQAPVQVTNLHRLTNSIPDGYAVYEFRSDRDVRATMTTYSGATPEAFHIHEGINRIVVPVDRVSGSRVPSGDTLQLIIHADGREFRP